MVRQDPRRVLLAAARSELHEALWKVQGARSYAAAGVAVAAIAQAVMACQDILTAPWPRQEFLDEQWWQDMVEAVRHFKATHRTITDWELALILSEHQLQIATFVLRIERER